MAAVLVYNSQTNKRGSSVLPDDRVHAPDLRGALQNAERLGEGLGLVCRSQSCPVTTATNSSAGVAKGENGKIKKEKDGQRLECNMN